MTCEVTFCGRGFDGKYWQVQGSRSFRRYFANEENARQLCERINSHIIATRGCVDDLAFLEWLWAWA